MQIFVWLENNLAGLRIDGISLFHKNVNKECEEGQEEDQEIPYQPDTRNRTDVLVSDIVDDIKVAKLGNKSVLNGGIENV